MTKDQGGEDIDMEIARIIERIDPTHQSCMGTCEGAVAIKELIAEGREAGIRETLESEAVMGLVHAVLEDVAAKQCDELDGQRICHKSCTVHNAREALSKFQAYKEGKA